MPLFKWTPEPEWNTVLAVDGMYFHAAKQALARAIAATLPIGKVERQIARLQSKIRAVNERHRDREIDDSTQYDKIEPLAIQMEGADYRLGAVYGPFLQELAAVQIFGCAALEAHVNIRGQELLSGRLWEVFERLPLEAKWLLLPKIHGAPGFDPGRQPFQAFGQLLSARNALVHYRVRRDAWRGLASPPNFLKELSLSLEHAREVPNTVQAMVTHLAKQLGLEAPSWLKSSKPSFFQIEVERKGASSR